VSIDLRLGDWRDVLPNVECDALISDPPYGARCHAGHDAGAKHANSAGIGRTFNEATNSERREMSYSHWTPEDVYEFVKFWTARTRGWFSAQSCHELAPHYALDLERQGWYVFAPIPLVIRGMTCRMAGDGPSSWAVWMTVARRKNLEMARWGTLPGAYVVPRGAQHIGGKPLTIMSAIVRDYSRPGDLVCDPCAGLATTALACSSLGRRFVGSEIDPETYAKAKQRLSGGVTLDLFGGAA
jgi:hypothetical protein